MRSATVQRFSGDSVMHDVRLDRGKPFLETPSAPRWTRSVILAGLLLCGWVTVVPKCFHSNKITVILSSREGFAQTMLMPRWHPIIFKERSFCITNVCRWWLHAEVLDLIHLLKMLTRICCRCTLRGCARDDYLGVCSNALALPFWTYDINSTKSNLTLHTSPACNTFPLTPEHTTLPPTPPRCAFFQWLFW